MTGRGGDLVITGIGELLTLRPRPGDPLGIVHGGAVVVEGGRVVFAGPSGAMPPSTGDRIDVRGALVSPGLCEPHAHPIFAGSRAAEFDLRAQGRSYGEIQAAGGGILATVRATRAASDEELIASTCGRLDRLLAHGVTVCEAKTGYALDVPGELRLLRLLGEAARRHPIDLSPTLLAHVPSPDRPREETVADFCSRAIPEAARLGAEAFDVYCDAGAFTLDETRTMLLAARAAGLALRVHAEQFTHTGAADLAAEVGARSVEHLEQLAPSSIERLAAAGTVCTLLPGAALTLRLPWPDARRLLDGGCTVALGTDLNPGSSLSESLPLMMSLGCMQMGMSCAEAWVGVTTAAARAVGRDDAGRLWEGSRGDLVIWDAADHREVPQHYGVGLARTVVIAGRVVRGA
ncbi:MAG: imidazolonepropionase [Myxococcales bacterium]|nr:imidazolonepropionase [Myxococcales bacterium]